MPGMVLESGDRVGHYEILAPLGVGGMGEVYRARDTKLNRDVALKVLPEAFVNDRERLARFEREAKVLASLNHPNIANIYGIEDSGDTTALVLELVEGPTLAERIAQGPIPLDEALSIARQIAEAVEAAHAQGIIHRDLKPANIKITPDGVVKVLDFGLAKAFTASGELDADLSQSPTLTKGTALGTIMGTAAYMSPEQAKGKPVDTRTDVWAFGVVLYEMLAGERAFKGEDASDRLVSVFRDEPDWTALSSDVPPRILQAIRVCLQKEAKQRVRDIAAVRLAMEGAFETEAAPEASTSTAAPGQRALWQRPLPALLVAMLLVVAGFTLGSVTRPATTALAVTRTSINLPQTHRRTGTRRRGVAVSPTGAHVVYVANEQLYLRAMDEMDARPLAGTEGSAPLMPFFSPDGQWIGFYSTRDGQLQKIALRGGAALTLCVTGVPFGASWGADDTIVFGHDFGVFQVSATGGAPELLVPVDTENGERAHGPHVLPDGRAVLFTLRHTNSNDSQIVVQSLATSERRPVIESGTDARYLPTGHLIYALAGNLLAVPFDRDRLEVIGGPVPLVENVSHAGRSGSVNFDISRDGMLVYLPNRANALRTLVWVDRDGREEAIAAEPGAYIRARISPDGTKAVLDLADQEEDLWVWDFGRETLTRLSFDPGRDAFAEWMPDGQNVVFSSMRSGAMNLYRKAIDGTGVIERLSESANGHYATTFTPDGNRLVFAEVVFGARRTVDLAVLTLDGDPAVQTLLDPNFDVDNADLSPDGRWLAYNSNASGADEVYVRPFPNVDGGRLKISSGGGVHALWGPDRRELFFQTPAGHLMRVTIEAELELIPGKPETILEPGSYYFTQRERSFDISPDGQRFLMIKEGEAGETEDPFPGLTRFIVVHNWFEELNERVPVN